MYEIYYSKAGLPSKKYKHDIRWYEAKWSLLALSQRHNIYTSVVLKLQNAIIFLSVNMSLFNLCIPKEFKSHSALSWQEFECESNNVIIWEKMQLLTRRTICLFVTTVQHISNKGQDNMHWLKSSTEKKEI